MAVNSLEIIPAVQLSAVVIRQPRICVSLSIFSVGHDNNPKNKIIVKHIAEKIPARISSNITPNGVDIRSAQLIGHGFIISKKRNRIKEDKKIRIIFIE